MGSQCIKKYKVSIKTLCDALYLLTLLGNAFSSCSYSFEYHARQQNLPSLIARSILLSDKNVPREPKCHCLQQTKGDPVRSRCFQVAYLLKMKFLDARPLVITGDSGSSSNSACYMRGPYKRSWTGKGAMSRSWGAIKRLGLWLNNHRSRSRHFTDAAKRRCVYPTATASTVLISINTQKRTLLRPFTNIL